MTEKKIALIKNFRELRRKKDMNQSIFWSRVGITQSGGSRYESGRNVPQPTKLLLTLAYTEKPADALALLAQIRGCSVEELTGKVEK